MNFDFKDITYQLPNEKIAVHPLANRADAQLLHYKKGQLSTFKFHHLDELLDGNSALYLNNTRVIYARLFFKTKTGATIEILCLEPVDPMEYQLNFSTGSQVKWKAFVGNNKRWKSDSLSKILVVEGQKIQFKVQKIKPLDDAWLVAFNWTNEAISFGAILEAIGQVPLPPYLNRASNETDKIRYQTVFAEEKGSVAAPTAGLHLTEELLNRIEKKPIPIKQLTLHVGAGTFKPIKNNDINQHQMHEEYFSIPLSTLYSLKEHIIQQKNIVAVGTTALRTLESIYWIGLHFIQPQLSFNQWTPYKVNSKDLPTPLEVIQYIIDGCENRKQEFFEARTPLLVVPGYPFQIVTGLVTNFHQPQSTLLLLVAAFVGEDWRKIYDYALNNQFRFLSFGDGSYLERR
jgi:S-adenosylmethionine:tRNA ribosyltransferase-isomerase